MHKIIYIDCDGTIENDKGKISERTKKALKEISELGNYVVLCTGRPRYHALEIARQINCNSFFITSNGAEIYDNINKKVIKIKPITKQDFIKAYNYSKLKNIRMVAVSENKEFVTKEIRNDSQYLLPDKKNEVKEFICKNAVKQIMLIEKNKEKLKLAREEILKICNTLVVVNESNKKEEKWITFGHKKNSKGNAMKFLTKYLNISSRNTIAIGNDYNDISMFEVAGTSIAMENTEEYIKRKADLVTLSNNEDGVAVYIEKLIKKEEEAT